jgi:uncharacterized membrane protein (DUF2068 family)
VRLIVFYKILRGVVSIVLALVLGAMALGGEADRLRSLAEMLREHVMGVWSVHLADLLVRAATPHRIEIAAVALAVDGSFVLFEGWALKKGFRWAPWLIVAASASFLPWEVYELYRHVRVGRALVLLVNVAIVLYLYQRERRARQGRPPA